MENSTQSRRASNAICRTVGILGGGTAGYLTALSFRALRPEISVTLIESSKIPIIGVGEATTSEIVPYLHRILGLNVWDFFQKVRPTWKLGIRFDWGVRPEGFFNYPFDSGSVQEPLQYENDLRFATLGSALMTHDGFPLLSDTTFGLQSILWKVPFAYHLDNRPFVNYLKRHSQKSGVTYIDAEIVDAELEDDGESIRSLVAVDHMRYRFDLYVDCTGFRSFLISRTLGSRFISYKSSLFTDSALVAARPHGGLIRPYTTAETMENGWCWNIPQVHEDHRGYVFASDFCSVETAAAEMRVKNPQMGDYWTVKFRTGRHEQFWKGNVVAIGNSYGFVEPLESTAIQVILHENLLLLNHLARNSEDPDRRDVVNRRVADYWDYIRWFLSIHYRFNQRLSTPFWRACRESVDISGAQATVDKFRDNAPLFHSRLPKAYSAPTFNRFGFDVLLSGQSVEAQWGQPREPMDSYIARVRTYQSLAKIALTQHEGLDVLMERPELLREFAEDRESWVTNIETYLRSPDLVRLRTK